MLPPSSSADPTPPGFDTPNPRSVGVPFLPTGQLHPDVFQGIRRAYVERTGYNLLYADADGNLLYGMPDCLRFPCRLSCRDCRREALERAIHDGQPAICLCADHFAIWGVPVMLNQSIQGALIVVGVPATPPPEKADSTSFEEACEILLQLAVAHNLTNREYLEARRRLFPPPALADERPRQTLSASFSLRTHKQNLEALENRLGQAILQVESSQAQEALEEIISILRSVPELPRQILQGYGTHLLGYMHQSAETASGRYAIVLEHCYTSTARLLAHEDPEEVFGEFASSLGTLLDLVQRNPAEEGCGQLGRALNFMETHFGSQITRGDVARAAGISESHLSRLLREKTGRSFTDILNRYRVDRAAQLLLHTHKNLLAIALEVGFSDQSYFGRVFRRYYLQTPDQYRQHRGATPES